ncbi:cytosolic carboxypeptidase 4-like [Denticeps clupeoides]|uniref:cytosolic carboxypeptidase 4-like n=1 Tax=Denticeps clupeoides TaxID=299321 RepID=UPI0010A42E4A|nr:cytosolic carboxypeptidase 4-like [Denticeps clupeoides]
MSRPPVGPFTHKGSLQKQPGASGQPPVALIHQTSNILHSGGETQETARAFNAASLQLRKTQPEPRIHSLAAQMFLSGRASHFTWSGTLKERGNSYTGSEPLRVGMTAPGSSGLEVLLSTLQRVGDVESTLNTLNVLDELLSAGTDRRIHYMISKGGSEALLMALQNTTQGLSPDFSVLIPLLHLLAKVGHRDRGIGVKAEKLEAVLPTLELLRHNVKNARRAAACLWVLRVFCSSVSTATLIGNNRGLDVIFRLISPHNTQHTRRVRAAIDTLAALLRSKVNCRAAVAKGYVSGLLKLYEDWHSHDPNLEHVPIRRALLHCLLHVTSSQEGRSAMVAEGGMTLLLQITQSCLAVAGLECLVKPAVQLMRKCLPRCPIPLTSDQSAYSLLLPGRSNTHWDADTKLDDSFEDESEDDTEHDEADCHDYEDDLETDVSVLSSRPQPDRSVEELEQYARLCPELHHNFRELDLASEVEDSSDEDLLNGGLENSSWAKMSRSVRSRRKSQQPSASSDLQTNLQKMTPCGEEEKDLNAHEFHSHYLRCQQEGQRSMVDRLLERYGASIPHHDPRLYSAAAAQTQSVAGYSILAFPDFWGHLPPPGLEPMAPRRPNIQRKKVLEDIQRFLCPQDVINKVIFDLDDPSYQSPSDQQDSLRFFSKFECGNLRKVMHIRRHEYDLILNADVNTSQHHQWFYFEVSGMVANVPYRFNIINCEKVNSQFNYGMQPVMYSVREALEGRPHWVRSGTEICYYRNNFHPSCRKGSSLYTLTFTVTFKHDEDVCYLAYHYPYSYSALQAHLQLLQRSVDPRKVFFRRQSLCPTLGGNSCPFVTITASPPSRNWKDLHQFRNRPCVVLTARVHPGESNASWVMKGSLEFLCSDDPIAQTLREAYVFKIVPMLNPDGVVNGTQRCSLSGEDQNRQWMKPDISLSPTIFHTKGLLLYLSSTGRTPVVFCDFHGHSRKKNVFLYGCSVKETLWQSGCTVDTSVLKEPPGYRMIPKMLDRIAPAFSFNSCNFLIEKSRASTARVVVWREVGVLRSYTMESTYNGCDQGIYKGFQIGTRQLEEMGQKFCQSLLILCRNRLDYNSKIISHVSALLDLDDSPLDHKSHKNRNRQSSGCVRRIFLDSHLR